MFFRVFQESSWNPRASRRTAYGADRDAGAVESTPPWRSWRRGPFPFLPERGRRASPSPGRGLPRAVRQGWPAGSGGVKVVTYEEAFRTEPESQDL